MATRLNLGTAMQFNTPRCSGEIEAHTVQACLHARATPHGPLRICLPILIALTLIACGNDSAPSNTPNDAAMTSIEVQLDAARSLSGITDSSAPPRDAGQSAPTTGTQSTPDASSSVLPSAESASSSMVSVTASVTATASTPATASASPAVTFPVLFPTPVPAPNPPGGSLTECTELLDVTDLRSTYLLQCREDEVNSYCKPTEDGNWSCNCRNSLNPFRDTYVLFGTDGSNAARLSALFCIEGGAPALDDDGCDPAETYFYAEGCAVDWSCVHSGTFDDGTLVEAYSGFETSCATREGGYLDCECSSDEDLRPSFVVADSEPNNACLVGRVGCEPGAPEVPVTCDPLVRNDSETSCAAFVGCGKRKHLGEDSSPYIFTDAISFESSCSLEGGSWSCECDSRGNPYTFTVDSNKAPAEACDDALSRCTRDGPFKPTGSASCEGVSQQSDDAECYAQADCTQPVGLGDVNVSVRSGVGVLCQTDGNGEWSCYCMGAEYSESFVGPTGTSVAVCRDAISACTARAVYDPEVGYGGFVFGDAPTSDAGSGN